VISDETDSLMVPYGIGQTSDTVDVCESWTGSDYDYKASGAGTPISVILATRQTPNSSYNFRLRIKLVSQYRLISKSS
jgi:hypothetical protein